MDERFQRRQAYDVPAGAIGQALGVDTEKVWPDGNIDSAAASRNDHVVAKAGEIPDPAVQAIYDAAREAEPGITRDMTDIARANGTRLTGLEYSVKEGSHVAEKIEEKVIDKGITPVQAIGRIEDLVRYTEMAPHNQIAEITKSTVR